MKREPPCKARRFYLERVEWTMRLSQISIRSSSSCLAQIIQFFSTGRQRSFSNEINEEIKFPSNETNKKMLFPANISSGVSTSDQIRAT